MLISGNNGHEIYLNKNMQIEASFFNIKPVFFGLKQEVQKNLCRMIKISLLLHIENIFSFKARVKSKKCSIELMETINKGTIV